MNFTVYKVTNTVNNKIYIGAHRTECINDSYLGSGRNILAAIKKYGKECFVKEILHVFDTEDEMFAKEAELVNETFVNRSDTYNIKLGGEGGIGSKKSPETRLKMTKAKLGTQHTAKAKLKMSAAKSGKTLSEEHKAKISKGGRGTKMPEEAKRKIALARKGVARSNATKEANSLAFKNTPNKVCPHCGMSCKPAPYKRWHGDNCKEK